MWSVFLLGGKCSDSINSDFAQWRDIQVVLLWGPKAYLKNFCCIFSLPKVYWAVVYTVPFLSVKCKREFSQFRDTTCSPAERGLLSPPGCSSRNNMESQGRKRNHSFKDVIAAKIPGSYFPGKYHHLPDEALKYNT